MRFFSFVFLRSSCILERLMRFLKKTSVSFFLKNVIMAPLMASNGNRIVPPSAGTAEFVTTLPRKQLPTAQGVEA